VGNFLLKTLKSSFESKANGCRNKGSSFSVVAMEATDAPLYTRGVAPGALIIENQGERESFKVPTHDEGNIADSPHSAHFD
jgi:hypothetical protein